MTSLETAKMAVKAIDSKKALDIKGIKIQDISAIADYFVIATGTSSTHVKALVKTSSRRSTGVSLITSFTSSISDNLSESAAVLCCPCEPYFLTSLSFIKNIRSSL